MKNYLAATVLLLISFAGHSAVTEQTLSMPDGLGQMVIYSNSDTKSAGPGVIVVHEWWGFNDYARSRARLLAELGYSAVAVDMYGHGKVAEHPDNAKAFMQQALEDSEKMQARFDAAQTALAKLPSVDPARLYAIGYCFGGAVVLNQARKGADLAGVASFHGMLSTQMPAKKGQVKAHILVATGGSDPFVPSQQVSDFTLEMANAGARFDVLNYPDAKHSFTDKQATENGKKFGMPFEYNRQADEHSWNAFLAMLQQ